jgi:hypothetical protein
MEKPRRRRIDNRVFIPTAEPEVLGNASAIADERIARRAYELYEQRNREDGRDMDDWLQAERELRAGVGSNAA